MTDIYDVAGEPRPKLCINCKHIGRNGSGDAERFRCFAPQNVTSIKTDLVTGQTIKQFHRDNCYDARRDDYAAGTRCGSAGVWFEPAPPKFEDTRTSQPKNVDDLLKQLDFMK